MRYGLLIAEVCEPAQEAADGVFAVPAVEVGWAEVAVCDAVSEHEVGGGEHGGCDGDDGLLGAAAGLDAVELGVR